MDDRKFRKTEEKYKELKDKHAKGLVSTEQLKEELKRLMVQDETGTYWMLGGKSGKWYRHDGTQWQETDPYEIFAEEEEEEEAFLELGESEKISADEYAFNSDAKSSASSPDTSSYKKPEAGARKEAEEADEGFSIQDAGDDSGAGAATSLEESSYNAFDTYGTYEIDPTAGEASLDTADDEISFGRGKVETEVQRSGREEDAFLVEDSTAATEVVDAQKFEYTLHRGDTAAPATPPTLATPTPATFAVPSPDSTDSTDSTVPAAESPEFITCGICKSRVPPYAVYCTFCGAHQKSLKQRAGLKPAKEESELLVKSIKLTSFLFFLGGLGLIIGVIGGAIFGVVKDSLPGLAPQLPMMLSEVRGGWAGGLIFAAIGGIGGFIFSAILAVILSGIYNLIAFIFGGIRFKVKR
jgi:hypothetical protein